MNVHHTYALTSRTDTNRLLRRWTSLSRSGFFCAILLCDVAAIVAMSWLTGVGYHLAVYGLLGEWISFLEVGLLSAAIFVILSLFRGEYRLPNFFNFRPHLRRSVLLWNVTIICLLALGFLAQISATYSRGWMLIYYASTIIALIGLRYLSVWATVLGSRKGLISAQRIFLFGTGKHVEDFISRYQPRSFGVSVVGCHFLTPVDPRAPAHEQRRALTQDLEAAIASARILEPDAIFLVMPWSATDTIEESAAALLRLPAEIHLGAEHILDRYEHIQLSKFGSMASLQLTRMPLSRIELLEKRAFDLLFASVGLLLFTPVLAVAALLI